MATHSSIHAWKIPWTEKPGGLQPMGSERVGQDLTTSLLFTSLKQSSLFSNSFIIVRLISSPNKLSEVSV